MGVVLGQHERAAGQWGGALTTRMEGKRDENDGDCRSGGRGMGVHGPIVAAERGISTNKRGLWPLWVPFWSPERPGQVPGGEQLAS